MQVLFQLLTLHTAVQQERILPLMASRGFGSSCNNMVLSHILEGLGKTMKTFVTIPPTEIKT